MIDTIQTVQYRISVWEKLLASKVISPVERERYQGYLYCAEKQYMKLVSEAA